MSFNIDACIIKQPWCGESNAIPIKKKKYYSKVGTRYECMKKGFGAGSNIEKRKGLSASSLQNIPYIGPKMESNFKSNGINTITQLKTTMKNKSALEKNNLLKKILVTSKGLLDKKSYNSTIMFLYQGGILNLPACKNI